MGNGVKRLKISVKKLCYLALLTAIALTIYILEAQIPIPIPVPGVKLGLANIITLVTIYLLSPMDALCVLLIRVFLGSMFTGQAISMLYSLVGGLFCWVGMSLLHRILSMKQVWICSIFGGILHNIGQILVAIFVTGTPSIVVYLPVLLISGILTGAFTGVCAQLLIQRLDKIGLFRNL